MNSNSTRVRRDERTDENSLRRTFPEEAPTRPEEVPGSRYLSQVSRIARHAELALERLSVAPDADTIAAARDDVAAILSIAGGLR